jgi:hypothetical protein
MNSIGGYLGMEFSRGRGYHDQLLRLNTGRNALEYILRARKYKLIYLPYYSCDALLEPAKKLGIKTVFYRINDQLNPVIDFTIQDDECFLYVNYFGIKNDAVERLAGKTRNLIIDNSQSFFSAPHKNVDTFYSCRKFFGVPDGAYLQINTDGNITLPQDSSFESCTHLLKYYDLGIEAAYKDFVNNEARLTGADTKQMSALTQTIMTSIDYAAGKERREQNFRYLRGRLSKINELNLNFNTANGPLCYPLLVSDTRLRQALINEKIFVPDYWPNVRKWTSSGDYEYFLSENLVALPVDQRYGEKDMKRITETVFKILGL